MAEFLIRVRDSGPLVIEGAAAIVDADGNRFVPPPGKPSIALCRCGASQNKPFCDGSHKSCGFIACERAPQSL